MPMNNTEFVGAHPVGDKAWHTLCKPSPTGVDYYGGARTGVQETDFTIFNHLEAASI